MVQAAILLKLLPASILDIYKVLEHINMLSIGIWQQPTQLYSPSLSQILMIWVTCGVKMMS
jgi:hypothetical protein